MPLSAPLLFRPVYQRLVWGGRRMAEWRGDLPDGPIGESWDLSDHVKGMSVVTGGPHAGKTLSELTLQSGRELVGPWFSGKSFPLMVKLIDAADKLSVQVHPDDALARKLGVGDNGKTECWFLLDGGGELYQGTKSGVDREGFEAALRENRIAQTLNRFDVNAGDFFFLDARTVHALGSGCLLYEIQQTSDVTFRVYDWGRLGLDGQPRPLHVEQSLRTIDFSRTGFGPRRSQWNEQDERGGRSRLLADCPYFTVEERESRGAPLLGGSPNACSIIVCTKGRATLSTEGGAVELGPMMTSLVPAAAKNFEIKADSPAHVLVSSPKVRSAAA